MNVDRDRRSQLRLTENAPKISSFGAVDEVNIWMASEIIDATDRIANRMLRRARLECSEDPNRCDQIAANILSIRRDIQTVAARIVDQSALDKEIRLGRVRKALGLDLRVAAALLLDLVDEPGLVHGQSLIDRHDDGHRRRIAVYASHIRRALRPHGLEAALITVRSRGYLISPADAAHIRKLWGEVS